MSRYYCMKGGLTDAPSGLKASDMVVRGVDPGGIA